MSLNNINRFHISFIYLNRHQRRINRRNRRQIRRMIFNRTYGRRASNNNNDTLDLIARLPLQITNDPFASQILNGSSFY
ncbi:unnamed protein product [Rhizophagus irregularis]|nr:unnamed protein product [Rhizophagus irregularis]